MPKPINIFIIYAREDKEKKQGLLSYLNPFIKPYNLNIWHDAHIQPGQEWKYSIDSKLNQTDLFLMLVSIDFMNSHFIHQVEFKYAVERHKANKSIIIPVIIRECPWDIDFEFDDIKFSLKDLQVLPDEGKPVDDWKTPDHAYNNIASGIRKVISTIKKNLEKEELEKVQTESEKKKKEEEEVLWNASCEQNTVISYKNYLDNSKLGLYKEKAGKLVEEIEKKNQEILAEKERQLKQEQDNKFWKETSAANTIASYKKYITETKAGLFKDKAEQAIKQLEAEQKEKEFENQFWQKAKTENTVNIYNEYLLKYPKGSYITDAANSINAIYKAIEKKKQEMLAEKERQLKQEQDNKFWKETSAANTIASYKKYITETKAGLFKDKAEQAIKQLEEVQKEKEFEYQFWQKAKTETTINIYNEYLERYPKGNFRTDASNAIKAIEKKKEQEILFEKIKQWEDQDNKLWKEASSANTIDAYQKYLAENRLAHFKEKAEHAIKQLEAEQREREIEELLWENTKTKATLEAYNLYLEKYPGGTYSAEAIAAITNLEEVKRKEEAAAMELINFKSEEDLKKGRSKKYLLIGGAVVILGAIIFGVTKFSNPSSGRGKIDEPKDSVTLIIEKYFEAIGGKEKLQQLNTITYEGTVVVNNIGGKDIYDMKESHVNNKAVRYDRSKSGLTGYEIFTPKKGWSYDPWKKQSSLEEIPAEFLNELLYFLDIIPLLNYTEKGHKIKYIGKEFYNGTECLKLKANMKTGHDLTIFFDPLTYYILKEIDQINIEGRGYTTTYSNFLKTPNGYVFPYSRSRYNTTTPTANQEADLVTTYSKIEINKPIDESLFKPVNPKPVSKKIYDSYEGGIIIKLDESGEHGLLVAESDVNNGAGTSWEDANALCTKAGWRLPTIQELNLIYSRGININQDALYWSSNSIGNDVYRLMKLSDGGNASYTRGKIYTTDKSGKYLLVARGVKDF
jgi:nucleoside diphosphate kinase